MHHNREQGWIRNWSNSRESEDLSTKINDLAKPIQKIVESIDKEMMIETNYQLTLIQNLRERSR